MSFGIYIHWPFCASKCPYCDFNSHVSAHIDHHAFAEAYLKAINAQSHINTGSALTSIYFGGGTPSTAESFVISKILEAISRHWQITSTTEITLEANPASAEAAKFAAFASAGVNRLSIGFQSFNDDGLKALGRLHMVKESLQALDIANKYFSRTNFDLIYARQNQSLESWQDELSRALAHAPEHLSLYQLGIEAGTAFGSLHEKGKLRGLPSDDLAADMFIFTDEYMRANGYEHYEISNFAQPNARSRHNMLYWQGGEYLGIGPGAHGRIGNGISRLRMATEQEKMPLQWLAQPEKFESTSLSVQENCEEYLLNALRIEEGAELEILERLGNHYNDLSLNALVESGHLWKTNARFGVTDQGRLVLNRILLELFPE